MVPDNRDGGNYDALKTLLESKDPLWKTQEIMVEQRLNIEISANSGEIINENGSIH